MRAATESFLADVSFGLPDLTLTNLINVRGVGHPLEYQCLQLILDCIRFDS